MPLRDVTFTVPFAELARLDSSSDRRTQQNTVLLNGQNDAEIDHA